MPLIDLVGRRFHRLAVLSYHGSIKRKPHWNCQCDCGTVLLVRGDSLKDGNTKSCGCQLIESATRHGHTRKNRKADPSLTYISWQAMVARCNNPGSDGFKHYGEVGIAVCERWRDFTNFLADMGERPDGTTLDRIDGGLGYDPNNCRWATPKQQARNRQTTRITVLNGESRPFPEWAEIFGIPREVAQDRLRKGWSEEKALTTPYTPYKTKQSGDL